MSGQRTDAAARSTEVRATVDSGDVLPSGLVGPFFGPVQSRVVVELRAEVERLRRHASIASGLLAVPVEERCMAWHAEANGVLATLAKEDL